MQPHKTQQVPGATDSEGSMEANWATVSPEAVTYLFYIYRFSVHADVFKNRHTASNTANEFNLLLRNLLWAAGSDLMTWSVQCFDSTAENKWRSDAERHIQDYCETVAKMCLSCQHQSWPVEAGMSKQDTSLLWSLDKRDYDSSHSSSVLHIKGIVVWKQAFRSVVTKLGLIQFLIAA